MQGSMFSNLRRTLPALLISAVVAGAVSTKASPRDEELWRLQQQLSQLQSQESNLLTQMSDLSRRYSALAPELDRAERGLGGLRQDRERLEMDFRRSQFELDQAQRQVNEARVRRAEQVRGLQDEISRMQAGANSQQMQVNQAQSALSQLDSQRNVSAQRQLAQEISTLEHQQQEKYNQAYANDPKIRELEKDPACKDSTSCLAVLSSLRQNRAQLEQQAGDIGKQIEPKRAAYSRLQDFERQYQQKNSELASLQSSLAATNQNIGRKQSELQRLQSSPLPEEVRVGQAAARRDALAGQISFNEKQTQDLSARVNELRRVAGNLSEAQRNVQSQLDYVQGQIRTVQQRIADLSGGTQPLVLVGSVGYGPTNPTMPSGEVMALDSSTTIARLAAARGSAAILFVDATLNPQRISDLAIDTLRTYVQNGNHLDIIGDVRVISYFRSGPALLALCRTSSSPGAPVQTSCGF